jgi:hypothetical protein
VGAGGEVVVRIGGGELSVVEGVGVEMGWWAVEDEEEEEEMCRLAAGWLKRCVVCGESPAPPGPPSTR